MRLRQVEFSGLTRFQDPDPVGFDLDQLGPGLVALVGKNGEGKTTALEAVFAALYGSMPSYKGSIYEQVKGLDGGASIAANFVDGDRELAVDVRYDGIKRTREAFLSVDKKPVTSGKGRDFDARVVDLFGSGDLVLSSVFSAQSKVGNFLNLDRAARRRLFVELLRINRLADCAKAAGKRRAPIERELGQVRAAMEALRGRSVEEAARATREMADGIEIAVRLVEEAEENLRLAQGGEAARREAEAAVTTARETRERLVIEHGKAKAAVQRIAERVAEAAAQHRRRVAELDAKLVVTDEQREAAAIDPTELDAAIFANKAQLDALNAATRRHSELAAKLSMEQSKRRTIEQELATALARIEEKAKGLRRQAEPLDRAPCMTGLAGAEPPAAFWRTASSEDYVDLGGSCELLAGARAAAADLVKIDDEIATAHAYAEREGSKYLMPTAKYEELVAAAALAQTELEAFGDQYAKRRELEEAIATDGKRGAAHVAARLVIEAARIAGEEREEEVMRHGAAAMRLADEDEEASAELLRIETEGLRAREAYDAAVAAAALLNTSSIESLEGRLAAAKQVHAVAIRSHATAEAEERTARENESRLLAMSEQAIALSRRVDDLTMLEVALGPNGAQALQIDAAGPGVSALVNDLLREAGQPFTVRIDTLREKVDGDQAEDFVLRVFHGAEERPADKFSGGQKVLIGEALGLGIAIYNAQRYGIRWETLFRDETAGALDPENAQAYVRMLRRAMVIGGFRNIVFVSHVPEVWGQADAVLHVEEGRIAA